MLIGTLDGVRKCEGEGVCEDDDVRVRVYEDVRVRVCEDVRICGWGGGCEGMMM